MVDVVADVCGLHAQLMSSAELAAWARIDGLPRDAVAEALWEERSLVKSWAMRGTLHLLPSSEYGLWLGGMSTYRHYRTASWSRGFDITQEELVQVVAAVRQALDHRARTREQLAADVADITGSVELGEKLLGSWGSTLKPATYQGALCFGPSIGRNVTFVRPDQWLGELTVLPGDEAMASITRRFLAANGPATRDDYARWWAMSPAAAQRHIAALGDEVAAVDVEGTRAWMLAADVAEAAACDPPGAVRLVPAFDQFVVASTRQAEHLLPGPFRDRVYRAQGWLSPVLLVDGLMAGVWRHVLTSGRLEVSIEPFTALPGWAAEAAEAEAEALGEFLGAEAAVSWSPAAVA